MIPGLSKVEIDGYVDRADQSFNWESQFKEIHTTRAIMTLWVRQKKPLKSVITLNPEDVEGAHDTGGITENN